MKASDIRDLTTEEILARIQNEEEKMLRLRLNHSVSAIESPSEIRTTRKTVARLKTILREREMEDQNTEQ